MRFVEWVKTANEVDKNELAKNINNAFFENDGWMLLTWFGVEYDADEVRAWAKCV